MGAPLDLLQFCTHAFHALITRFAPVFEYDVTAYLTVFLLKCGNKWQAMFMIDLPAN